MANITGTISLPNLPKRNKNIEYIVVHYTAGTSSSIGHAKSTIEYFKTNGKASADFAVDDKEIWQGNDDIKNKYTEHCGGEGAGKTTSIWKSHNGKCTNENSIGIEMCSNIKNGGKVNNALDPIYIG